MGALERTKGRFFREQRRKKKKEEKHPSEKLEIAPVGQPGDQDLVDEVVDDALEERHLRAAVGARR